jgi:hypothetical protein
LSSPADRVGERLSELKVRSGRSYEWLARRTHLSKSSVQRYCTSGVPPTFGTVESIALACGADGDEVAELFRLWSRVGAADPTRTPTVAATSTALPDPPSSVVVSPLLAPQPAQFNEPPAPPSPPRGHRITRLTAVLVVLVTVVTLVAALGLTRAFVRSRVTASGSDDEQSQPAAMPLMTPDPLWSRPPGRLPSTFFGVTLNSTSGAVPGFMVGAVRLWDSGTRWAQFEPTRGRFEWTTIDRHVEGAQRAHLPVLFVFGGTPRWANPDAPASPYLDGGRAAAPLDLGDWDDAVRAVVQRYRGRIEAYELWPLGNDPRFYNGSVATLVDVTRRAARIIRATDPQATILCPGMGNLWTREGQGVLRRFAEAGGYDECDVASIKLYQQKASDPPETMLQLAATVDRLLHIAGVQPRIWVTGTTYSITEQQKLDPATAREHAVRYYLAGLYGRTLNLERMYFYNWGGTNLPVVLQPEGLAPTPAALAVDRLQHWLTGASSTSCGNGPDAGLPAGVWQCRFTFPGRSDGPPVTTIRWTLSGSAQTTAAATDRAMQTLDGRRTALRPGDRIALGPEPVLIEQSA